MSRAPSDRDVADSWQKAVSQQRDNRTTCETEYMSAIDLSRGKVKQPAVVKERSETVATRKIIFETDSIEISIKNEPVPEDIPQQSDEDESPAAPEVDPMEFLAPFTPHPQQVLTEADQEHKEAAEVKGDTKRVGRPSGVEDRSLRKVRLPGSRGKHFVCECGESFIHRSSLRIHRLRHTGEPRFKCDICGKVVTTGRSLQNHRLTHSKTFRCQRCPKVFGDPLSLEKHTCVGASRRYTCVVCGVDFGRKAGLEKHALIHLGEDRERTHVCELCGKAFYQVGHLLTHRSVHSSERPYACDQCDRRFSRNSFLTSHKRTHIALEDKPRPFVCSVCSNAFMRRCDLNKHALLHSGTRAHVCRVCGKAFSQSGHLVSHSAVHTGARPHQCQTCGKSFKRKTALRRHEITPHAHSPQPTQ